MKLAVACEGTRVSGHFGHCEGFKIYNVRDNEVVSETFLENPGHKPGFLPQFLRDAGVNTIIGGGMGEKAQNLFREGNIEVVVGARGNANEAVEAYLGGNLKSTGSVCKEHQHAGECGEH